MKGNNNSNNQGIIPVRKHKLISFDAGYLTLLGYSQLNGDFPHDNSISRQKIIILLRHCEPEK